MKRPLLLAGALTLGGCVYLNTLYNARTAYEAGERARLAGQADSARQAYEVTLRKAAESFRRDSLGGWAMPSLLLVGQAHLRLGSLDEGRAALERVLVEAPDPRLRQEARLYLGAILAASRDYGPAVQVLNEALLELRRGDLRGEGHMWRARVLLAQGRVDQGWWDLDRAMEEDRRLEVPGHLERLSWAIERGDPARAEQGARALLRDPAAGIWVDSLSALVERAAGTWSPGSAAALLSPARGAPWAPGPRDRMLLQRIDLLLEAGDTLAAETELGWVARGAGPASVPARLALAEIRLRQIEAPRELDRVRRVLLPVATDSAVVVELEALRMVELLAAAEERSFVALFAAAELAREALGAPRLARALYLEASRNASGGSWRGKAALAALVVGPDSDDERLWRRDLLRERDPYLTRARNRYLPTDTLARLDARLQPLLDSAWAWARTEAGRRDVLVRSRAGGT